MVAHTQARCAGRPTPPAGPSTTVPLRRPRRGSAAAPAAAAAPTPRRSRASSANAAPAAHAEHQRGRERRAGDLGDLRDSPDSACASWMRCSSTVCGTSPVYAGRKKASAVPNSAPITTMCQTRTAPVTMSTASTACRTPRATSLTTITRWRGNRSASTPPSRTNSTSGRAYAVSTRPTSRGSPVSRVTNSPMATTTSPSPSTLTLWPSHRSRNSRRRRTDST